MEKKFEILEHPADVGFVAYGQTLAELLENSALAMMSLACETAGIEERERREIRAHGADNEALLFDWLAEILAVADADGVTSRIGEVEGGREYEIRSRYVIAADGAGSPVRKSLGIAPIGAGVSWI